MNVALLLGLSLSADSFAVCCAMTACRQAGWKTALRLAGSFALFQALLPLAGWFLMNRLGWLLKPVDHWIAFVLLGFVGGGCFIAVCVPVAGNIL